MGLGWFFFGYCCSCVGILLLFVGIFSGFLLLLVFGFWFFYNLIDSLIWNFI